MRISHIAVQREIVAILIPFPSVTPREMTSPRIPSGGGMEKERWDM